MLKREWGWRKQREATAPIQSLVKLQPWFLSLRWKTCFRQNCSLGSCACSEGPAFGQNTLVMINIIIIIVLLLLLLLSSSSSSSSSECSAQGQVLHCKRRNLGCSSAERRYFTGNSGTKVAVFPGIEQLPVAFRTPVSLQHLNKL